MRPRAEWSCRRGTCFRSLKCPASSRPLGDAAFVLSPVAHWGKTSLSCAKAMLRRLRSMSDI
eukprot:3673985-Pleurochrysis_carterae.AAC.3